MFPPEREPLTAATLLDLADAPVKGESNKHLLRRLTTAAARLPGVDAASCNLTDDRGQPQALAASTELAEQLERTQAELREGPCVDSQKIRKPLANLIMTHPHSRIRWPHFAPRAVELGYTTVTALPIHHERNTLGALNLYLRHGTLPPTQVQAGALLTNAVAIGLSHRTLLDRTKDHVRQLQDALNSRVLIEQAKGILAERLHCTVDDAFDLLRHHARSRQLNLTHLAKHIVDNPTTGGPFPCPPD
ncbi:ANTAR domain-containing protein [Streptomyces sp. NPDC054863]